MWINLQPQESIINLDLQTFDDFENDDWEYIFWNERDQDNNQEDINKQSDMFLDSVGNLHDSSKRVKKNESLGRSYQNRVSQNFIKKETQKSDFSNRVDKNSPSNVPISRNLTILRRNVSKKSTHNSYSSQSIHDSEKPKESNKEELNRNARNSQGSLPNSKVSGKNSKEQRKAGKSKNIARVLTDNQRKDMGKIHKSVDEFLFLMENPSSWVSKLEIEYKDYLRGNHTIKIN